MRRTLFSATIAAALLVSALAPLPAQADPAAPLPDGASASHAVFTVWSDSTVSLLDPSSESSIWMTPIPIAIYAERYTATSGDVDGDGVSEILFWCHDVHSDNNLLYCLDPATGTIEWSALVGPPSGHFGAANTLDADGDGRPEIAVVADKFYLLDGSGNELCSGLPVHSSSFYGYLETGDFDGDGRDEAATISPGWGSAILRVAEATTAPLPCQWTLEWQYSGGFPSWTSRPRMGDADGDGIHEGFAASYGNYLTAVTPTGAVLWQTPSLGGSGWDGGLLFDPDVTGDGLPDVLYGSSYTWVNGPETLYCLRALDGTIQWTYQTVGEWKLIPIAAGDVEGDGVKDVVACRHLAGASRRIFAVNGDDGSLKWESPVLIGTDGNFYHREARQSEVLADIDADGILEVPAADIDGRVVILNAANGELEWCYQREQATALSAEFLPVISPTCVAVEIDIKPGSDPNPINPKSHGVTPVVVFSSPTFDATDIDPTTVLLAGAPIALKPNGRYMVHEQHVNGDGLADLFLHVETDQMDLRELLTGCAVLTGSTYAGLCFHGSDIVTVVPHDLADDHWALDEIAACINADVVCGYPDGTYHPEGPLARDQMAVYVARAIAGGDDAVPEGPDAPTFADVSPDYWAYDAIEFAAAANVVQGYGDGSYYPDWPLTRDQMAVYIARAIVAPAGEAGLADYDPPETPTFLDVPATSWCYSHVEYLAADAIVAGYDGGAYQPAASVTRDQMAVYIARAFHLQ